MTEAGCQEGWAVQELPILSDVERVLEEWLPPEASIAMADEEKYILYHAGQYDLHLHPGDKVRPGSIAARVLKSGRPVETDVDASVYGVPYHGIGYPLQTAEGLRVALAIILPPRFPHTAPPLSFVTGQRGDIWQPIPVSDIAWFESSDKHTWFYTADGGFTTKYTLQTLEQRLPAKQFLRIHRSYIVNVAWIRKIERDFRSSLLVTVRDPLCKRLPVAQSYVKSVREKLGF
jgi:hypothetical protein